MRHADHQRIGIVYDPRCPVCVELKGDATAKLGRPFKRTADLLHKRRARRIKNWNRIPDAGVTA